MAARSLPVFCFFLMGAAFAAPDGGHHQHAPQVSYQAPRRTYNTPQPTYHAPRPTYHAPLSTYQPTYHAPQPTYQPTYHAPQPTYQPTYHNSGYRGKLSGHATVTYTSVESGESAESYERGYYKAPVSGYATPAPPTYATYHQTQPYQQPKETYHPAKKVKVDTDIAYTAPILKKTGYGYHAQVHKVGDASVHQYQSLTSTHGGGYKVEKPGYGGYNKVQEHYVDSKPEYKFGYDIDGGYHGKISAHESRKGYVTRGSYSFKQPDGLTRIVDYYVDEWGFHPTVRYVRH